MREISNSLSSFNPTLVRLRHEIFHAPSGAELRFNPTLVRLRRDGRTHGSPRAERFQSHAGSIEAMLFPAVPVVVLAFQSHAGSIEAGTIFIPHDRLLLVSIPRWFD